MTMKVSCCLKCYNQAEYIALALEGLLAQTYRPLEIVIADDASTDGSLGQIQKTLSSFGVQLAPDGRKGVFVGMTPDNGLRVVVARNEGNLGNVGNWQRLCELAQGDILVKADGDDISMPNRVETIVAAWEPETMCLVHAAETMDLAGRPVGTFAKADGCFGAASSYSRQCFTAFGPIFYPKAADDEVYLWRAKMLGRVKQIQDRLIHYRVGSGFSSIRNDFRRRMWSNYERTVESRKQSLVDAAAAGDGWPERVQASLEQESATMCLWSEAALRERWLAFNRFEHGRLLSKGGLMHRMQLLPRPLADMVTNTIAAFR